jgi:dCTP deaminase
VTVLPDHEIGKLCRNGVKQPLVFPYERTQQQPASYDLRLGHDFIVFDNYEQTHLDLGDLNDKSPRKIIVTPEIGFTLHPLKFALGVTMETVWLPDDIAGKLEGKSSLARTGLLIHVTGGFVDPGFHGPLTLEFFNAREIPIILRPGIPIAQIGFSRMDSRAAKPYRGRYQNATTVEPSKYTG